jgi:hypothetical protein
MRYLLGFVFALALVASPPSVSAQAGEESATSEPNLEEPAPTSEPAPEDPALQLKLDDAGVEIAPSPPRTPDGYTIEEMELRVKRAGRGLIGTSVILGLGVALSVGAAVCAKRNPPSGEQLIEVSSCFGLEVGALVLIGVGSIGMIVSGPVLGARKRKLRRLQGAHSGRPPRVQWDLARSRLVF